MNKNETKTTKSVKPVPMITIPPSNLTI